MWLTINSFYFYIFKFFELSFLVANLPLIPSRFFCFCFCFFLGWGNCSFMKGNQGLLLETQVEVQSRSLGPNLGYSIRCSSLASDYFLRWSSLASPAVPDSSSLLHPSLAQQTTSPDTLTVFFFTLILLKGFHFSKEMYFPVISWLPNCSEF